MGCFSWQTGRGREKADEIVSAAWVIPVETDEVLANHSVVTLGGKILDILPTPNALAKYTARKRTALPHAALMPGFVNAHTHTAMVYLRGVSDDIPLREWLEGTIWPLEFQFVKPDFVRDAAELAILEMIRGGTTLFNDMYWFPEAVCEAVVRSGIRATIGMIAIEFPFGSYGSGADEYLAKGEATRNKFAGEEALSWAVALHAPYTCSDDTLAKGGALSRKHSVPFHIHLHETSAEVEDSATGKESSSRHMSKEKCRPLANLKRLGVVDKHLCAVHMNHLLDEEIALLSECQASVIHCPSSGLKLASGMCRVADLLKAGVNVAIGTDGASSNNTLDMLAEMKLAALLAKGVSKDAKAVPAITALRMATLHGARALGLGSVTGSLVAGKSADFIAMDFSAAPATWPQPTTTSLSDGFDAVTHTVYSSTRDQVSDVWVRGRRLMAARRVLTIEERNVRAAAEKWGAKVTQAVAELHAKAAST